VTDRQARGARVEQQARALLERAGLEFVGRNYRCARGEIDLVMADGDTLVFVEVRFRASRAFGGAAESIDARKRARIVAAAQHYLLTHRAERPCRFDVVAADGNKPAVWLRDAFRPD
jgi:putative endonuclease